MNIKEKYKIKSLLRKARIASGRKYMKQADRRAVLDGIVAISKLGVFDKPAWACKRKER